MQRHDSRSKYNKTKLNHVLKNIFQVPLALHSALETAPRDYIIFTHQLEERAQQMGPLLITTSTCSKGESGGFRQHVLSCVIGF